MEITQMVIQSSPRSSRTPLQPSSQQRPAPSNPLWPASSKTLISRPSSRLALVLLAMIQQTQVSSIRRHLNRHRRIRISLDSCQQLSLAWVSQIRLMLCLITPSHRSQLVECLRQVTHLRCLPMVCQMVECRLQACTNKTFKSHSSSRSSSLWTKWATKPI